MSTSLVYYKQTLGLIDCIVDQDVAVVLFFNRKDDDLLVILAHDEKRVRRDCEACQRGIPLSMRNRRRGQNEASAPAGWLRFLCVNIFEFLSVSSGYSYTAGCLSLSEPTNTT